MDFASVHFCTARRPGHACSGIDFLLYHNFFAMSSVFLKTALFARKYYMVACDFYFTIIAYRGIINMFEKNK